MLDKINDTYTEELSLFQVHELSPEITAWLQLAENRAQHISRLDGEFVIVRDTYLPLEFRTHRGSLFASEFSSLVTPVKFPE